MKNQILMVLFVLIFLGIIYAAYGFQRLPLRSECIVAIQFYWPDGIDRKEKNKILEDMSNAIAFSSVKGGPNIHTSQSYPLPSKEFLYLQFEQKKNCKRRLEVASELMSYVWKVTPNAPYSTISKERIMPGLDTIESWGPPWRDKPQQ